MLQSTGPIGEIRATLDGLATSEARIAVTVAFVLLGVMVVLLSPWLITRVSQVLSRRLLEREQVPIDAEDVNWLVPAQVAIRTLQMGAAFALVLTLLVIWGRVDLATALVEGVIGALPALGRILATIALIGGAVVATDLVESWVNSYVEDSTRVTQHQQEVVFRVLQVVVLIAAGLAVLTVWEFNPGGLLVGAGFLGIVVGMAARQTLGALIAGFVLMFSRPFEVGDWVVIEDQEGIITDITIVNTRIRSFDGETVVIPNDRVSGSTIVNRTDRDRLRLRVEVGIDYDADVDRAEEIALAALEDVDNVLDIPSPQVIPTGFGDSAIVLELRFWIDRPTARRRWRTQAEVIRAVKAAFDREGIKIPFPQRELAGREETGGFRVVDGQSPASDVEAPESGTPGRD